MVFLFYSAILVLVSLWITPCLTADPVHVSLSRQSQGNLDTHAEAYRMQAKYGRVNLNGTPPVVDSSSLSKRGINYTVPFVNQGGGSLLAPVQIGTPPQTFSLILDTGSADLWVASINCSNCILPKSKLYYFNESSTFMRAPEAIDQEGVTIRYGNESVSGPFVASELISIAGATEPFTSYEVVDQRFVPVYSVSFDIEESLTQGIMGLALYGLSQINYLTFFQDLTVDSHGFELPGFSFWIQRTSDTQEPNKPVPGGVFTIGGANSSFYTGDIEFLEVPPIPGNDAPSFWVLNITHILVNGMDVPIDTKDGASLAAFDTASALIAAPSDATAAIWKAAGGIPLNDGSGLYQIPCSSQINISMSFGGRTWPIDPRDMIHTRPVNNGSICTGAIFDIQAGTHIEDRPAASTGLAWVIGGTFLTNVYSTFLLDPLSIGFAQLSDLALATAPVNPANPTSSKNSANSINVTLDKIMVLHVVLWVSLVCSAVFVL